MNQKRLHGFKSSILVITLLLFNSIGFASTQPEVFRLERENIAGGAELLTIFGKFVAGEDQKEIPLVSVVRDSLGDENPENDRLRYVWMHTYTHPTLKQKLAAAIPFFYNGIKAKNPGTGVPPPIIDLANADKELWQKFFWITLQSLMLDPGDIILKASTRTYTRNIEDYRRAHIIRALAILSLFESETGSVPAFTDSEMRDIQARLMLTEKFLGGIVDDTYLSRVYQKQRTAIRDIRGHNWELLRQRAEAEGLYFEPLQLPDGSATHAILWASKSDVSKNSSKRFNPRFLSISNPWNDQKLKNWNGYTKRVSFNPENTELPAGPETTEELIPLGLYGLDNPRIPILLVDFRDNSNPRKRELSRRTLDDVARNILNFSKLGDLHYLVGRSVLDFVTGRRGMDINQPTRLRAYSQLRLLLSLNVSLDPQLREQIKHELGQVTSNPLESHFSSEVKIARDQYRQLMAYARHPRGLSLRLEHDRREEMSKLVHTSSTQALFRVANILSFGLYSHKERITPSLQSRMENRRRVEFHTRFLIQVTRPGTLLDVSSNLEQVRSSLRFLAHNNTEENRRIVQLASQIFRNTTDEETRKLSLACLYRVNNQEARNHLFSIYKNSTTSPGLRELSAYYLGMVPDIKHVIDLPENEAIITVVGQ